MYDLRVELSSGSYADASVLRAVPASIPSARKVTADSVRLTGPTQIDASSGNKTVLVPGAVVGIDLAARAAGRGRASPCSRAATWKRPTAGEPSWCSTVTSRATTACPRTGPSRRRAGNGSRYVGQGLTPDYFIVLGPQQTQETAADYAVVFTSIETAQRLLSRPGQANELLAPRAVTA